MESKEASELKSNLKTWDDFSSFEEMFAHLTENRDGFAEWQMSVIRMWMSSAATWKENQLQGRIFALESVLLSILRDGVESDRFDAGACSVNRRVAHDLLKLSIADYSDTISS